MRLDETKEIISTVLMKILIYENNGFDKRQFYIVNRLLWAIKNYPTIIIPSTRIGILLDNYTRKEYVVRFEEDILWVGIVGRDGSRDTGGHDYTKEYFHTSHQEIIDNQCVNECSDNLIGWQNDAIESLDSNMYKITIECYD